MNNDLNGLPVTFGGVEVDDTSLPIVPAGSEDNNPNQPTQTSSDQTPANVETPDATTAPADESGEGDVAVAWYQEAAAVLGIELEETATFDSNVEGITSLVKTAADKLSAAKVNEYLSSNPTLRDVAAFILNGGDIKEYVKATEQNWSSLSLKDDDEFTQVNVITQALKASNLSDGIIESFINSAKDSKTLPALAKDQLKILQAKEEAEKTILLNNQQKYRQEQEANFQAEFNLVIGIVEKGIIADYILPKEKSKDFLNAFYGSDENSITAKYEKLSVDKKLAVAMFIENDAKPLAVKKASTPNDMFTRRTDKTGGSTNPSNNNQPGELIAEIPFKPLNN